MGVKILCSWIGTADLRALYKAAPSEELLEKLAAQKIKGIGEETHDVGKGPVATLLEHEEFDEVHLLINRPELVGVIKRPLRESLGNQITIHAHDFEIPTDYPSVYKAAHATLEEVTAEKGGALSLHLSPGTPTMAAVWVLLGKTKYPARFWQTYEGKASEADVPFDLTMDVLPEILRNPDRHLQELALSSPSETHGFEDITGKSQAIRYAVSKARRAAIRDVPVLLVGESGTGKEMFARAIHKASLRSSKQFLPINCAAIPSQLIESMLFGHKKGAFTGADKDHDGMFLAADNGTIFLDEVGELPPEIQAKLLRVLQPPPGETSCTREFSPVGSSKTLRSNVRILAATNRDLPMMTNDGGFREDLYYRLAVFTVTLPPLRERRTDLVPIANVLVKQINRDFGAQEPGYVDKSLSKSAERYMKQYQWPGNVRQLQNALIQAAVMSDGSEIEGFHLEAAVGEITPRSVGGQQLVPELVPGFSLEDYLNGVERPILEKAMRQSGWSSMRAAELLGFNNYQTLNYRLKKLGIKKPG